MIVGIAGIGSGGGHAHHHVLPPPPRLLLVMPNNDSDVHHHHHHHLHRIRIRRMRRRARGLCCIINHPLGTGTGTGKFVESAAGADDFSEERSSPDVVRKELKRCYQLVHKLGRGVVYLGSSRLTEAEHHPHYLQALELAREIAKLLDCTTWRGAGPGLMDAAFKGALEAKKPIGGFKITRESGEWTSSNFHPYLPAETYLTCRFFSARKHALVDAAVRNDPTDMTAVVAFPGGIGTLDEVFEILALILLERIGSKLPIPILLMNYDSYYSKLLDFIRECELWGSVARGEVGSLWKVCSGNFEALEYLSEFYSLPQSRRNYDIGVSKEQGMVS